MNLFRDVGNGYKLRQKQSRKLPSVNHHLGESLEIPPKYRRVYLFVN